MYEFLDVLTRLGQDYAWLITANFALSVLLLAWLLRYRRLYMRADAERRNKHNLIENLAEGIYTSSLDGRMLSANTALARLNGYASEAELIGAVRDIANEWYVDPGRRAAFRRALQREGCVTEFVSEIYRHRTRERIWVSESARLVYDPVIGKPVSYEGSVRDITDDMRRFLLEERLEKLTSQAPGGFYQIFIGADGVMKTEYTSSGLMPTLGRQGEFDPRAAFFWVHEDDRAELAESQKAALAGGSPWSHVFRVRGESGAIRWIQAFATPENRSDGVLWHGHLHDTTERKNQELAVAELAYVDGLTRLPNRRMLLDRLPRAMAAASRRKSHGALLFIDLDDFKTINDTYGHDTGDAMLASIGDTLREAVRRNDIVARIGGDEFVVLLEDIGGDRETAIAAATVVAQKIRTTLRNGLVIGNVRQMTSASIGVAIFDGSDNSPEDLIKSADLAMYDAKGAGKNSIQVFDPALLTQHTERYRLLGELHNAIVWERLTLHFQPVLDAHGRVTGAEGLLRWPHETRGLIEPESFMGMAEKAGLANDLTKLVLTIGVQTLAEWQADPKTERLDLSLNIATSAFLNPDFPPALRRLVDIHQVDATRLTLELGEAVLEKDAELVRRRMDEVRALGVRFALDDFGAGRSSVESVKMFAFEEIKINGAFVANLETRDVGRLLVKTLLAVARTLEIEAVAKHVETESQLGFLVENGCNRFQGYLFSTPKRNEDFVKMVAGDGFSRKSDRAASA